MMKLFLFVLLALACLTKAEPEAVALRGAEGEDEKALFKPSPYVPRKLGPDPRFLGDNGGDVTFNREYNEDGEPPAGRAVSVSIDYPVDEPMTTETLKKPSEDEHGDGRRLYYNCYTYCWWHWYYGWITYCCPYWGCAYYYC